ncbi:MAG: hypothetical protein A3E87_01360 [Gammaproteobacteria bacterium RIFCSPHIGHO2_12_FULL_35_23]|nr:MAG: hypothetical protein A3E87_01360 [Gammaproteobacteria bacterium RIFCSPHIGHO2_12_FULL_35_23]
MSNKLYFLIPNNHPSLSGHFPGNPIVPGVVILQHVLSLLTDNITKQNIHEVSKIKFITPLLIDVQSEVIFKKARPKIIKFEVLQNNQTVVTGNIGFS